MSAHLHSDTPVLVKTGRLFYGIGLIAYGIQQVIIQDFRPQILPGFPAWAHQIALLPIASGVIMVVLGLIVAGTFRVKAVHRKNIAFCLGLYFFALILLSHIPYLLFVYPHKLSHLGSWGDALKGLAFSGASLVIASSFRVDAFTGSDKIVWECVQQHAGTIGRLFFCTTIILFGCNHFAYDISFMVPGWIGMQTFWSYFAGAALIGAGVAIVLNIFRRSVSFLLACMIFLWFLLLHAPNAISHPYAGRGNQVVSAFDALLFSGVALVIGVLSGAKNRTKKNRLPAIKTWEWT